PPRRSRHKVPAEQCPIIKCSTILYTLIRTQRIRTELTE
ncbi:MAG: hypothetical protein ACI8P0_000837, partial [Planctomycetaceae bacterium]